MSKSVISIGVQDAACRAFLSPRAKVRSTSGFLVRLSLVASLAVAMVPARTNGQKAYDPGASDTEIEWLPFAETRVQ